MGIAAEDASNGVVVQTSAGQLRGALVDGVHAFLGVPYAAPPFGAGRLRPPGPVAPWDGVREATRPGPEPPQVLPPATGGPESAVEQDWGEIAAAFESVRGSGSTADCLNLNLWTPDPGSSGLPVMVWIQGGMFEISSTAAYDGRHFARDGVVCVVVNWRPGAEGFLHLDDGITNLGLLDQVAALEWVQENVADFGGDPGNVTVFGESAGAMSIGCLLAMPRAEGLFRRAILQSGAAAHVLSTEEALHAARELAGRMGVETTRDAIAGAGVERLLTAQTELKAELMAHPDPDRWGLQVAITTMAWQPVVDGDVLPASPMERLAGGASAGVDVLVGTNVDDWRLWLVVSGALPQITDDVLLGPVGTFGGQCLAAYGLDPVEALAAYRQRYPASTPGDLLAAVQTDWWMRLPALRLADAHVRGAGGAGGTYMYEFAWPAPGLGAVHASEVPFVFDTATPTAPLFGSLLGPDPPQDLARTMHRAWVDFAARGDPGWPAYGSPDRATMRFDTTSQVVRDPRAWELVFWDGIR